MEQETLTTELERVENYEFKVKFDLMKAPQIIVDEPEPLGRSAGPNASRLLSAAVGNCLSASLLFCLGKARIPVRELRTSVETILRRNERGRLRIAGMKIRISPSLGQEDIPRSKRCLETFEDFCVVTQSVRQGIQVDVEIEPSGDTREQAV